MSKVRPTPWRLSDDEYRTQIIDASGRLIAQLYVTDLAESGPDWLEVLEASGGLMAAAPVLLEACRAAEQCLACVAPDMADERGQAPAMVSETLVQIRAAIAFADEEPEE